MLSIELNSELVIIVFLKNLMPRRGEKFWGLHFTEYLNIVKMTKILLKQFNLSTDILQCGSTLLTKYFIDVVKSLLSLNIA